MGTNTALDGQFGLKKESTYGTGVTVDRFLPFTAFGVTGKYMQHVGEGIVAGRMFPDVDQVKKGVEEVGGPIEFELAARSQALIWELLLGTVNTSGAGPYTHTITPTGSQPSATIQGGITDVGGTVRPFTIAGAMFNQGTLSGAAGEIAKMKVEVIGQTLVTATSLASASYADGALTPMIFREGSATVNGSAVNATSFEVTVNRNLQRRILAGASSTAKPLTSGRPVCSGKITAEFEDLTEYNLARNATELDVVLAFSDGTYSTTVTVHTKLADASPAISGLGVVTADLVWEQAFGDGSDSDALTVVCVNADSTA